MATFTSILIRRENEAIWDELKTTLGPKQLNIEFNALFNCVLPNLAEAIKSYNPETKMAKINLGPILIR